MTSHDFKEESFLMFDQFTGQKSRLKHVTTGREYPSEIKSLVNFLQKSLSNKTFKPCIEECEEWEPGVGGCCDEFATIH